MTNTYTTALTPKQVTRKVLFPHCLIEHNPLSQINIDLDKENARIKQVLKENGYRESIINKIFRTVTNHHSLPQSQQLTQVTDIQEEEIRISINLLYVEGTSEKLQHILRSHKIRSTFYTEMTV